MFRHKLPAIDSKLASHIAFYRSCMNEVKKCFGKDFDWFVH